MPAEARFCPICGSPLGGPRSAAPVEERRLVTIVFADLAGFTERSDRADPEDVRRILVPFHAVAKQEIERFGGTLDKFIGDAAMGVFGAPVAHEDDPERAVRAALAIRDLVAGGNLPVRIAVHTGEALVTSGEGPTIGEHVAGDVVNTASRLQSFAPEDAVIVGEPTQRATRHLIAYEPMPSTRVKGKAEPLSAFLATSVRTEALDADEDDPPPFVGRVRERELLHDLLQRTIDDRTPRLVTIVGEPGIGKTRLVLDLHDHLRITHVGVGWHRGRCRPFGESITYAALDEVVRSIAGIVPGASGHEARARLEAHLSGHDLADEDRAWLSTRLRALLGIAGDDPPVQGDETVGAWTRFLEATADVRPLTIVIEDLHWADDALLDFLERLMERAPSLPLFVLCSARPELFARRPAWASSVADTTTITLSPLTDPEMSELLGSLLARSVMSPSGGDVLLRRAGGNPLYAREFVHMLEDRGQVGPPEASGDGAAGIPDTVQALIAARLDVLDPPDRALLQTAAVVGDRFWQGALEFLATDAPDIEASLRNLQRRGLIRRSSTSVFDGQTQHTFAHALIRDVAYGRLPRAARSSLHHRTATWLDTLGDETTGGQADLRASHAARALDLARAAGLDEQVPELEAAAMRAFVTAGDRQVSLDAARAASYYDEALALAPPGPERAEIRRSAASLGWRSGGMTSDEALEQYRLAEGEASAVGDDRLAARVLRRIYYLLGLRGDTAGALDALARAIELVEHDPDAVEELAELYACRAEAEMFAGRSDDSRRWADRALELASTQTVSLMALHLRGNARCETGDLGGVDDLRQALAIAESSGVAIDIVTSASYLLEWVGLEDGPSVGLPMNRATIDLCRRRGIEGQGMWSRAEGLWLRFDAGLWHEVLAETEALGTWAGDHGDAQIATVADLYRARVLAHRGEIETAVALAEGAAATARQIEDLQVLAPALMVSVVASAAAGEHRSAIELAEEFEAATGNGPTEYRELYLPEIVRALLAADARELAARVVGDRPVHVRRTRLAVASSRVVLAAGHEDPAETARMFREVAAGWEAWGGRFEQAHALAGLSREAAEGSRQEADDAAAAADAIFDQIGVRQRG